MTVKQHGLRGGGGGDASSAGKQSRPTRRARWMSVPIRPGRRPDRRAPPSRCVLSSAALLPATRSNRKLVPALELARTDGTEERRVHPFPSSRRGRLTPVGPTSPFPRDPSSGGARRWKSTKAAPLLCDAPKVRPERRVDSSAECARDASPHPMPTGAPPWSSPTIHPLGGHSRRRPSPRAPAPDVAGDDTPPHRSSQGPNARRVDPASRRTGQHCRGAACVVVPTARDHSRVPPLKRRGEPGLGWRWRPSARHRGERAGRSSELGSLPRGETRQGTARATRGCRPRSDGR